MSPRAKRAVSILALIVSAFTSTHARAQVAGAQAPGNLEEIVVSAQRRSERQIDVPMSITAVSGDELTAAGITNTRDLAEVAPGINFVQNSDYTIITIRGIGSFQSGAGAENDVAIYLDGSYLPSKVSGIFDLPDVSNIEVLKGPQGTLWGRNATAGAVLINTLEPSFKATGSATVGYGSYNDEYAKFYVTDSLVDGKLAGSLTGYYENMDGYQTNVVTGENNAGGVKSWLLRGKLLLTPTDDAKIVLAGMYSTRDDMNTPILGFPPGLTFGSAGFTINPNAITTIEPDKYASQIPASKTYWNTDTWRGSLDASFNTSLGLLSSVFAATQMKNDAYVDGSFTSAQAVNDYLKEPEMVYTADVNFASKRFGRFQFLAGGSYINDKSEFGPVYVWFGPWDAPSAPILTLDYQVFTKSSAGYIEGDADITDQLSFVAGVRYTHERLDYFGHYSLAQPLPFVAGASWDEATPRASLKYKITDRTNVYLSYSRGFKSGSFDYSSFTTTPVNPEIVDGLEIGIKSDADQRLSLAAAGFYQAYKDIQVETLSNNPAFPLVNFPAFQNAAHARVYGVDLDATYRPIDNLSFGLKLEALSAKYNSFPDALVKVGTPLSQCPPASLPAGCGAIQVKEDVSGTYLPAAPNFTGTFNIDYVTHPSFGNIDFNANLYVTSKFYWSVGNVNKQPGYALLNGRISWTPHNGPYTLAIWGKNLTNRVYTQGTNEFTTGIFWAQPITVGAEISAKF